MRSQVIVERKIKTRNTPCGAGPPYTTETIPLDKYEVVQTTNLMLPNIKDILTKDCLIQLMEKNIDVIIK